ncbi:TraB/GumN family protein [Novosphingobium aquiterrae]|uniref:TraB/GumN family protein n=1 Tax=Novosphingobium aquiterrae TaxID=624388 RepID=A0ABV6PJQ9_9SPHN
MSSKRGLVLAALGALALFGCRQPEQVHPALWQIDGPNGQKAWLLGTIHALPAPVDWHSPRLDAALAAADRIVLEVARIDDDGAVARTFATLGATPTPTPLRSRLPGEAQADYDAYLKRYGVKDASLAAMDTWAGALVLAQAAQQVAGSDSANGVDRAIKAAASGRPVEEFEGADAQLRIFEALPETEQRDLLLTVIADTGDVRSQTRQMERAWSSGDLPAIEAETQQGMLADPELRAALLTQRNQAWLGKLLAMLGKGQRPFVAVGTAHLVGPEGLPALLAARGYRVTRVQ